MSTFEVSFPKQIPVDAGKELFSFVKDGFPTSDPVRVGRANAALFNVQGYFQGLIGDPDKVSVIGASGPCQRLTFDEGVEVLGSFANLPEDIQDVAVSSAIPLPVLSFLLFLAEKLAPEIWNVFSKLNT